MHPLTRKQFNLYRQRIAELNGVDDVTLKFTVSPTVAQTLEARIQESSGFLSLINIEPVLEQTGQKVGLSTGTIAGRVDTSSTGVRNPSDPTTNNNDGTYFCRQTNYDWAIRYAKMDQWRHKPEFQTLFRDAVLAQQARDRIMIGFNGTQAAATTNRTTYPLLQDVNIGWLHQIRQANSGAQLMNDGELSTSPTKAIYVSASGEVLDAEGSNVATAKADYASLDALTLDALELLDEPHRGDTDLVVIVGWKLVKDKYLSILQKSGSTATEVAAGTNLLELPFTLGGKKAVVAPFFPDSSLLITSLDNLSIYWQEETRRRHLAEEPNKDRVANYESVNEAYVVEDFGRCALVENIVLAPKPAGGS